MTGFNVIRFRPLLGPTLWFVFGFAMLAGLGVWQVQRLHEKEALIASVETGMRAAPVPLGDVLRDNPANGEYRHVRVIGHFLHESELYLFSRGPMGAVGVDIVTPLVQENGQTVLVDRGFVPDALHDPKTRQAGQVAREVALTGVLRRAQLPGMFTPAPNREARLWFVKDVPQMAAALGVAVPPILIEADATPNPGGWPLGGLTVVRFRNSHLVYAITWFGLAVMAAAGAALMARGAEAR